MGEVHEGRTGTELDGAGARAWNPDYFGGTTCSGRNARTKAFTNLRGIKRALKHSSTRRVTLIHSGSGGKNVHCAGSTARSQFLMVSPGCNRQIRNRREAGDEYVNVPRLAFINKMDPVVPTFKMSVDSIHKKTWQPNAWPVLLTLGREAQLSGSARTSINKKAVIYSESRPA